MTSIRSSLTFSMFMTCFLPLRVESYIPGAALLLGFSEENERNARQEVSASVVVASADSVDVKIKFPEVLEENVHYQHLYAKLVLTAVFTWMCHFFCLVISIQSTARLFQFHCQPSVFCTSETQQ